MQKLGLWLLLFSLVFSSCGTLRETSRVDEVRWGPAEFRPYEQQLRMPLTGRENPELIIEVASWMGTPYLYGGGTRSGADCSGFVHAIYRDVYNMMIPRTVADMARESWRVRPSRLQEGDLLFFRIKGLKVSHVGIYLGNGYFIHVSTSRGVMVNNLQQEYYRSRFLRGGRFR